MTTANVQANQITQDRIHHGSWEGDIAEILIYERALTPLEENMVGVYLAGKYGLETDYDLESQAKILAFGLPGLPATIDGSGITWNLPYAMQASVTALAPVYDISYGAQGVPASGATCDFSEPVVYTITSYDAAITNQYTVTATVLPASSDKDILTFGLPGRSAWIDDHMISWTLPYATDLRTLSPAYTISALASVTPASGTARDFTTPQALTVTAEDGSTKVYTVTASVEPQWPVTINVNYTHVVWRMNGLYSCDGVAAAGGTQVAPLPYAGYAWNDLSQGAGYTTFAVNNLGDSQGVETGISLATTMDQGPWDQSWSYAGGLTLLRSALSRGLNQVEFVEIIEFANLKPTHIYDLVIVCRSQINQGKSATFRIGEQEQTTTPPPGEVPLGWVEGLNYLHFKKLQPSLDGKIEVEAIPQQPPNRYDIALAGLQLLDLGPKLAGTLIFIR